MAITSRYMCPTPSKINVNDCSVSHRKQLGYSLTGDPCVHQSTDLHDKSIGEFSGVVILTKSMPLFTNLVRHVVCMGAYAQVIWINAARIVTRMAYYAASWQVFPGGELNRDTVRIDGFAPYPDHAVASARMTTSPFPTSFALLHISPKAFFQWPFARRVETILGAILFLLTFTTTIQAVPAKQTFVHSCDSSRSVVLYSSYRIMS